MSPFDPNPPKKSPDPVLGTRAGYQWCATCGGIKEPGHEHFSRMGAEMTKTCAKCGVTTTADVLGPQCSCCDAPWITEDTFKKCWDLKESYREDNARLRALVNEAITNQKTMEPRCPWCFCSTASRIDVAHEDCPAFTPEGDVK